MRMRTLFLKIADWFKGSYAVLRSVRLLLLVLPFALAMVPGLALFVWRPR
jgi:hypothetical protein